MLYILLGEIVKITKEGVRSLYVMPTPDSKPSAFCIFEYVYFARPDSIFEGMYLIDFLSLVIKLKFMND